MAITQTITAFTNIPSIADPVNFAAEGEDFLGTQLPARVTEMNTWATQANALATAMTTAATGFPLSIGYTFSTTTTDADPGAGYLRLNNATQNAATVIRADLLDVNGADRTAALDAADDSTSTVKGFFRLQGANDGTDFLDFSITSTASPSGYRNITVVCVNSSAANPFANGDQVVLLFSRTGDKGDTGAPGTNGAAGVMIQGLTSKSANYTVVAGDANKVITATSTGWTLAQTAAATLGANFSFMFRNEGTGPITINPNGTETVDGLTTILAWPGESFLMICDGANWQTQGRVRKGLVPLEQINVTNVASITFASSAASWRDDPEIDGIQVFINSLECVAYSGDFRMQCGGSYSDVSWSVRQINSASVSTPSLGTSCFAPATQPITGRFMMKDAPASSVLVGEYSNTAAGLYLFTGTPNPDGIRISGTGGNVTANIQVMGHRR